MRYHFRNIFLSIIALLLTVVVLAQSPRPATGVFVAAPAATSSSTYPDTTNTGYAYTGVTLTAYTGSLTITVAGTTIDSKDITGCVVNQAANVVIKRSFIHGCTGNYVIDNFATSTTGGTNLLVEDTTIICNNVPGGIAETGISDSSFTARRVDITKCENGIFAENDDSASYTVLIIDSYIHDMQCYGGGDPHIDGVQLQDGGRNITMQHNRIYGSCDGATAGQHGNSAIFYSGNMHNVVLTDNILSGGGYTLYCNQLARGAGSGNSYTNNKFYTLFLATIGSNGPTADCGDEAPSETTAFTGNVCYPSGTALTGATNVCDSTPPPAVTAGTNLQWVVTFQDEFGGSTLDLTKWTPCFDWNTGSCTSSFNAGKEHYQSSQDQVSSGTIKMVAQPLSPALSDTSCFNNSCTYKSGMVSTARPTQASAYLFPFTYGYIESKMKYPGVSGFFTAFWMVPTDTGFNYRSEIDIAEILGGQPSTVFMTYHYNDRTQSYSPNSGFNNNGACAVSNFSTGFVTIGVDWEPTFIAWYINGTKCGQFNGTTTTIESGPMQLIMDVMIDNQWERDEGLILANQTLVNQLEVDYVRVYQKK